MIFINVPRVKFSFRQSIPSHHGNRLHKFKVKPRAASARSTHPSLPRTGELATQFDPARQPETPTSPESEKALRLRKRTQWIDRVTRAALLESLHSGLSKLGDQEGGMVSLIGSFGAKITSTKGWFEALGYIPRDDLECESKIYDWEEGPNTRRMIVQITGKPTEDNADIGVRLACSAEVARELGSDHTVPTTTKRYDNSKVGVAAGNSQAGRCHRDLGGGGRDGGVHGRGLRDAQTAKVAIRVAEIEMNIYAM